MNTSLFKTSFAACILCMLFSFSTDSSKITIHITSPTHTSSFKTRDTVRIKADIQSSEALHNVIIKVISLKDSSVIFSKQLHSHSTSMHIDEFYINPVVDQLDVKLSIYTTGHEDVETARSEVIFVCKERKRK